MRTAILEEIIRSMVAMRKRYILAGLTMVFGLAIAGVPASAAPRQLVFGFLPILSPERLSHRFEPLIDYLAGKIGASIKMETAPGYREFARRTEEKRYDLLYTAPHFYYVAQRRSGYRVVARVAGRRLNALIVAPVSGGIRTLSDLRGKTLSTPNALALGTLLIRDRLRKAGLTPEGDLTLVTTPTHNASLISAYKGFTDAAGSMVVPFERTEPTFRGAMRILAVTASTPQMPFSVASRLAPRQAEAFANALIDLSSSDEGKSLLTHLHWPGFVRASPEEYDVLRRFVRP